MIKIVLEILRKTGKKRTFTLLKWWFLKKIAFTGFELLDPKFMGMTPDQWREHKRNIASENETLEMDMDY